MCLVIDANMAGLLFGSIPEGPFAAPVFDWLSKRGGCLVLGGLLREELLRLDAARVMLVELARQGRVHSVPDEALTAALARVGADERTQSNDAHVVALCLVSGARIVATNDNYLIADLKVLVRKPKVRIYRTSKHHAKVGNSP